METFNGYGQFNEKLKFGNKLEDLVCQMLINLGYDSRRTPQGRYEGDPELGNCDVVCYEFGRPVFGIECKTIKEPFRISPYGDENIPINKSSRDTYQTIKFPVWILAVRCWDSTLIYAPLSQVVNSPFTILQTRYKDTPILNYDGSEWRHSKKLKEVLTIITES